MSVEVDVLPIAESNEETARLADLIEGVAGEFSPFEQTHGFSIDGVDLGTSALPDGWRDRLVRVQNANTAALSGEPQFTGWCLDKEDLCVAKLCALRGRTRTSSARCSTPASPTPPSSRHGSPWLPSGSSRAPSEQSSGCPRVERRDLRPSPTSDRRFQGKPARSKSCWSRGRRRLASRSSAMN